MRLRPLFVFALALVLGIVSASFFPWNLLFAIGFFLVAVVSLFVFPCSRIVCLSLMGFFLFGFLHAHRSAMPERDNVVHLVGKPSGYVQGVIVSEVEVTERGGYGFVLRADTYRDGLRERRVSGKVQVFTEAGVAPVYGDRVEVRGRLELPRGRRNPGGFDYRGYLGRRGIFTVLGVKRTADYRKLGSGTGNGLFAVVLVLRERMQAQAERFLPGEDAALFNGILLGTRTQISADWEEAFARTGTVHILSASGLHLSVLAWTVNFLLVRCTPLSRRWVCVVTLAVLWLYALLAGAGAAPVRSALVATVLFAAPLVKREGEPLHALVFAGVCLLCFSPLALYDLGAQLTFVATGALIYAMPPLERLVWRWEPEMTRREKFFRVVLLVFVVSVVADVATAPLIAYYFNLCSFVAPFANVPIVLLTDLLLKVGLLAVLVSPVPYLSGAVWGLCYGGLWLLKGLTLVFAAVPFAAISVVSPPVWGVVVFYIVLFGGVAYVRHRVLTPRVLFTRPPVDSGDTGDNLYRGPLLPMGGG